MTNKFLNHDKTKALLIHATAASSTKEVAELIGAQSSRISEGKDKRWRLPVESEQILVEEFGPARAERGDYFEAEVWGSFNEYKKQSPVIVAKRQLAKIATILNDDVKLCEFLDSIDLIDTSIVNKVELRQVKLDAVNKLIYHPTFIKWHKFLKSESNAIRTNSNVYRDVSRVDTDYLLEHGIDVAIRYLKDKNATEFAKSEVTRRTFSSTVIVYSEAGSLYHLLEELGISDLSLGVLFPRDYLGAFAGMLYLLGEFTANYQWVSGLYNLSFPADKYLVGMKLNFSDPVQHKPIVLTGDVIWNDECQPFTETMIFKSLDLLPSFIGRLYSDHYQSLSQTSLYRDIDIAPDRYNAVKVQLNLTKSMSYHMYFQLGEFFSDLDMGVDGILDPSQGRTIVIKDIRADEVFDVINDFADYFKLQHVPMIEIKQMIAKNGGFIPGAMYLE